MRARALVCGVALLVCAAGSLAQSLEQPSSSGSVLPAPAPLLTRERAETPAGPAAEEPASALEMLEQQIRSNPPPLEPKGPPLAGPILGGLATVGCAVWALTPTINRWGPEDEPDDYLRQGLGWGVLQGFLLSPFLGIGWVESSPWYPDMRAEYGNLLDLEERDREQRAYQILRKRAGSARQQRVVAALLTVGSTALSAAAYYMGSALIGPNDNVQGLGIGYVVGIAVGSLPWALVMLATKSEEETLLAELEAGRRSRGRP